MFWSILWKMCIVIEFKVGCMVLGYIRGFRAAVLLMLVLFPVVNSPALAAAAGGKAATKATADSKKAEAKGDSTAVTCLDMPSPLTLGQLRVQVEQSSPAALYCLGGLYDTGISVAEDPLLAAQWIRGAADLGYVPAMIRYGEMLAKGRGVLPDMKRAALWFRKAAERDHTEAQAYLGELYEMGQGVDKDMQEASAWYARAALKKHPVAQTRLGLMFSEGRGVKKDLSSATLLLYDAALHGQEAARQALLRLGQTALRPESAQLLGMALENATRQAFREALHRPEIVSVREDNAFICDVYNISQIMPGATLMAACYVQSGDERLGLLKIDYPTANKAEAQRVKSILEERFGSPTAREGEYSQLWNFGKVMVVGQYVPTSMETSLLYVIPEFYTALPGELAGASITKN